jgi:hypothetical protein
MGIWMFLIHLRNSVLVQKKGHELKPIIFDTPNFLISINSIDIINPNPD